MRRDDAQDLQPEALSPHARDLYRALRRDCLERLRSLVTGADLDALALIAGRRLEPDHPLLKDWRRMCAAARELNQNCKVRL
ncbi:MAG: hypothetical protein J0I24_14630 [Thiomonas arsenitoxydans]|uniref:Uncharacterized protein n=1 Tax=Thiomonas arsenitoxydans (strain DSM 22701 / CIP 110005 / 3As) TaxID=426114 RepID=A0A8I1MXQ2_THIA3|nr:MULTISPECIES: hypothetical protein [Thiomonas]MBN8745518.1 hypothetical protein [Thiomonas arsenitoxydans]ODU96296.1 MAG: hypothetical protein ABT24_09530 [Thiomonas sp. SCN 64-16]